MSPRTTTRYGTLSLLFSALLVIGSAPIATVIPFLAAGAVLVAVSTIQPRIESLGITPEARLAAARHEAGHAIVVHRLGHRVLWMSVSGDTGCVRWSATHDRHVPARDAICAKVAGLVAEATPDDDAAAAAESDFYDLLPIAAALAVQNRTSIQDVIDTEVARAREIIASESQAVERLASELVSRRTLSGGRLRALLAEACEPKSPDRA